MSATIHASAVQVGGAGILIRGASGSGKSSLVLALLEGVPDASALIADDRVALSVRDGRLCASPPAELEGLIEVRGLGIVRIGHVAPAPLDLVVDLVPAAQCARYPEPDARSVMLEGVALSRMELPENAHDGALRIRFALRHSLAGVSWEL
jgi:serine kinase of HPr protein (carbohydrate metabolism regulator)